MIGYTTGSISEKLKRVAPPVTSMNTPPSMTKLVKENPLPYHGMILWKMAIEAMPQTMPMPAFQRMVSVMTD